MQRADRDPRHHQFPVDAHRVGRLGIEPKHGVRGDDPVGADDLRDDRPRPRQRLGRHLKGRGAAQFVHSALAHQLAARDHADPVADLLHLTEQVAGEHDRVAVPAEFADEPAHVGDAGRVEPVGRLVQDQQFRILQQCRGQTEALLHAQRVRGELVAAPVGEADDRQHFLHARVRHRAVARERAQVVPAAEVGIEGGRLDEHADVDQCPRVARLGVEHPHGARGRADQTEQDAQRRGLAGAVGSEEAVDLAPAHGEVELVDGTVLAVPFGQSVCLDQVVAHRHSVLDRPPRCRQRGNDDRATQVCVPPRTPLTPARCPATCACVVIGGHRVLPCRPTQPLRRS